LKNDEAPSVLIISLMTVTPETLVLKLAFWIRVLTTSRGAATVIEATAPATEATKSAVSWTPRRQGSGRTLGPGGLGVVLELEEVLLGHGGTTEELLSAVCREWISLSATPRCHARATHSERAGSVTGHGPAPAAVERGDTLLGDELDNATALERVGVGLHLDLEDVEGEEDNLTDTGKPGVSIRSLGDECRCGCGIIGSRGGLCAEDCLSQKIAFLAKGAGVCAM
jgi:hypothetical protein